VEQNLADVVLVDVIEGVPQGKGLDMFQSGAVEGFDMKIVGSNGYDETEGSDLVIVTAGLARKPGMSRDDLLRKNEEIVGECIAKTSRGSRDLKVIVVTNPLDAMCEVVRRVTKLPKQNVIGMAGILDSARMRAFISMELGVSMSNIHATVLGGHGDTMVPLPRYSTVAGVPITELMSPERVAAIVQAHRGRRRRDREPPQDRLGVLRAVRGRRRDGRGHLQRPQEDPPVRRVPRGRVRDQGPLRGRPRRPRRRRASRRSSSSSSPRRSPPLSRSRPPPSRSSSDS
jgi:hypothetical protein